MATTEAVGTIQAQPGQRRSAMCRGTANAMAAHPTSKLTGTFMVMITAQKGESLEDLVKLGDAEIDRLKTEGPTELELKKVKIGVGRDQVFRLQSAREKADFFNANNFFLNANGQPRPVLKQNQFGGTIGGPIRRDKTFFFGSYQGSRQVNGEAAGALQTTILPPLTNDRSAAALGAIFGGQSGAFGGVAVAPNGSNINPVALALLNAKLANGSFAIPTPQAILPNELVSSRNRLDVKNLASSGAGVLTRERSAHREVVAFEIDQIAFELHHLTDAHAVQRVAREARDL